MKKYKLIKKYPGSPSVGVLAQYCTRRNGWAISDQSGYIFMSINNLSPEHYPEFWEEVVEKEYEILSFEGIASGNIYYLRNDKYYLQESNTGNTLEHNLKSRLYTIHSIKRLSDGEVFTIGDKIDGPCGKNQEITKIDTDWIYYLNAEHVIYTYRLSDIKKAKQPLFTTDIKDGIYYDGEFLEMSYEELCDLFARYRDYTTEYQESVSNLTIKKAKSVFGSLLPMTSY